MNYFIVGFLTYFTVISASNIDIKELMCVVCDVSIMEIQKELDTVDPNLKMEVRGYNVDPVGNYKKQPIAKKNSEIFILDVIDNVCAKMENYVRATYKTNGTLTLLKLVDDNGAMSSKFGEVDIVQDDDINRSVKYYCDTILGEHEEVINEHFQKELQGDICNEINICPKRNNKEEL